MIATLKPIRILSVRRIIEAIKWRRFLPVFVIVWLQAASTWVTMSRQLKFKNKGERL